MHLMGQVESRVSQRSKGCSTSADLEQVHQKHNQLSQLGKLLVSGRSCFADRPPQCFAAAAMDVLAGGSLPAHVTASMCVQAALM